MNKTAICSTVALEIIDYSKRTEAEQAEIRKQFDALISQAVVDIPESDRVIMPTAQGAVIVCCGPLEGALEDALFISLTIRDEILKNNMQSLKPWYMQIGINLGSVRIATSEEGVAEVVGDGVEEAKRIMSFANPNQILVSRVYYEMASKLTQDIAKMFEQYDMHAHEQDIYAVRLLKEKGGAGTIAATLSEIDSVSQAGETTGFNMNWIYALIGIMVLSAFFILTELAFKPAEPEITMPQPESMTSGQPAITETETEDKPVTSQEAGPADDLKQKDTPVETAKEAVAEPKKKAKSTQKKPKQEATATSKQPEKSQPQPAEQQKAAPNADAAVSEDESKAEENSGSQKSGWQKFKDSVKQGSTRECTQAEIALSQCK